MDMVSRDFHHFGYRISIWRNCAQVADPRDVTSVVVVNFYLGK